MDIKIWRTKMEKCGIKKQRIDAVNINDCDLCIRVYL